MQLVRLHFTSLGVKMGKSKMKLRQLVAAENAGPGAPKTKAPYVTTKVFLHSPPPPLPHHRHSAHLLLLRTASPALCNSSLFILARCPEPTSHHRYSPLPLSILRSLHLLAARSLAARLLPAFGRGIYRFVSSVYSRMRMDRPPLARCKSSPQYSCTLFSVLVSGLQVYYTILCSQCRRCSSSRSIPYLALSDLLLSLSALLTWGPFTTLAIAHLCHANQIECSAKPDLFAISQLDGGGARRLRLRGGGHYGFLKVAARAQIKTTSPEYAFALAEAIQRARSDKAYLKKLAETVSAVSEQWDPKVQTY
jgi:hypothetical protein